MKDTQNRHVKCLFTLKPDFSIFVAFFALSIPAWKGISRSNIRCTNRLKWGISQSTYIAYNIFFLTRIKTWWRHQMKTFSALLVICAGIHWSPVNSPHKGQWHGALMFTLICARINGWVNNRGAGDLRRNRAHYGVIVMIRYQRNCCRITIIEITIRYWALIDIFY